MEEKVYDSFPLNNLEQFGKIKREPFNFISTNCKVWHKGQCILDLDAIININAKINENNDIVINMDNSEISEYISDYFLFSEISHSGDRILWSNNFRNGGAGTDDYDPINMSLFFYKGVLSRVYLNVANPRVMLELTTNKNEEILDSTNSLVKEAKMMEKQQRANTNFTKIIDKADFISTSHLRFENGIALKNGIQKCNRAIKIEKNINGCEGYNIKGGDGYIVTIFNLDGNHPMSGNNIQIMPKPMRIINQSDEKIVLRGYQCLAMSPLGWVDFDGSDYGLSIYFRGGEIGKCVLHLHNRDASIEYYK